MFFLVLCSRNRSRWWGAIARVTMIFQQQCKVLKLYIEDMDMEEAPEVHRQCRCLHLHQYALFYRLQKMVNSSMQPQPVIIHILHVQIQSLLHRHWKIIAIIAIAVTIFILGFGSAVHRRHAM